MQVDYYTGELERIVKKNIISEIKNMCIIKLDRSNIFGFILLQLFTDIYWGFDK